MKFFNKVLSVARKEQLRAEHRKEGSHVRCYVCINGIMMPVL